MADQTRPPVSVHVYHPGAPTNRQIQEIAFTALPKFLGDGWVHVERNPKTGAGEPRWIETDPPKDPEADRPLVGRSQTRKPPAPAPAGSGKEG